KIPAATEVGRLIDHFPPSVWSQGWRQKVRISIREISAGPTRPAVVAVVAAHGVDKVAAQSHELVVSPGEVQWDWSNCEPLPNLRFFAITIVRVRARRTGEQPRNEDRSQACARYSVIKKMSFSHFRPPFRVPL